MAGGKDALLRSAEGAEDETDQAAQLHAPAPRRRRRRHDCRRGQRHDAVHARLPARGEAARCADIGIANNRGTPILDEAECPIWLDTGAEPIAGSTRMKAGTAQRVTLNLLSSLVMIRLGRVHEGLWSTCRPINAKFVRRSENILRRLSGRSSEEVADALRRANGNVKLAMLLLHGCSNEEATGCSTKPEGGCARRSKTSAGARRPRPRLNSSRTTCRQ